MAVISQPAKLPEWNSSGSNRTEPLSSEKIAGWVVDDEPPSSYFNWLHYYAYIWLAWVNQRLTKGPLEHDVQLQALQPDASGNGGNLLFVSGAPNTAGAGGAIQLTVWPSTGANGGAIRLEAGDSLSGGAGGNVIVEAGDGASGNTGGDITITAGDTVGANGGDATFGAGNATGTNRQGGQTDINGGNSTGNQGSQVNIQVAEASTSGAGVNTIEPYISANGGSAFKRVTVSKHLYVDNSGDNTRGAIRLVPEASIPSAPLSGDIYPDSGTGQLRHRDSVGYRGLNSFFDQPNIGSLAVNDTVQERPFTHGTGNVAVTIPANYLSVGSIIRIRAVFVRSGTLADEPGFRIRIGTHGTLGADSIAFNITSQAGGNTLTAFFAVANLYVNVSGGSGNITGFSEAHARASSATWVAPQYFSEVRTTAGIDTTVARDFYPTVYWHAVGAGNQSMTCPRFFVDVI